MEVLKTKKSYFLSIILKNRGFIVKFSIKLSWHLFSHILFMLKKHHPHQSAFNSSLHAFAMWLGFFLQHIGFVENCEGSLIPLFQKD